MNAKARRRAAHVASTTLFAATVAAVLVTAQNASATPPGVANTLITCTSTVSTRLPSLLVSQGIACIDGTHGGGVTGSVAVTSGAGLYVENATVGSIMADHPHMVWLCGATTGSIQVSSASGYAEPVVGPVSFVTGIGCPVGPLTTINGSVSLSHDHATDFTPDTIVNGSFYDTYNDSPSPGQVCACFSTVLGSVVTTHSSADAFVQDALVHGPVVEQSNTALTDVNDSTLYNGLVLVSNSGIVDVHENRVHGQITTYGNGPTAVVDNTFF